MRKPIPSPPLVIASKTSWDKIDKNKNENTTSILAQNYRTRILAKTERENANRIEWLNPLCPNRFRKKFRI